MRWFLERCRLPSPALTVLVAWSGFLPAALGAPPAAGGAAADQFTTSLFDGRTLEGWTIENDCEIGVEDGLIVLQSGNGWLRSDHTYKDFLLHVEWKAPAKAKYDAGVYVRTLKGGKDFPKVSYQVNLLEGDEGNIRKLKGASSQGLVKPGDWNSFDITVVGETIALAINGKDAYKARGVKQPAGYVGLQCEVPTGGRFQFRNLRITEFGHRSLFNGKDLTGWIGAKEPADKCWEVRDGLLVCNGAKGTWLRSDREYGDFNLRLDFQVSAGGNSGVFVRVPEDGNHHRENESAPPAGFEVQILDDSDKQYNDLKVFQYSGSAYDIAGASPRNVRSAGHWNTMEINCRGQHITISQNGAVVVDLDDQSHPLIKLRSTRGFLGLQNHNTVVKFRNVRIGPAL
jgi:hypothetical protein